MQARALGNVVSTYDDGSKMSNTSYQPKMATKRPNVALGHIHGNGVTRKKAMGVTLNESCSD